MVTVIYQKYNNMYSHRIEIQNITLNEKNLYIYSICSEQDSQAWEFTLKFNA